MCCKFDLSRRISAINGHLKGKDHPKKLQRMLEAQDADKTVDFLVKQFFEKHPDVQQRTVPTDTHVYRWTVMETMMYAGVPYAKIDMLRQLLEREGHALSAATHLGQLYIPQINDREIKRCVKELLGEYFAVIFDGTTRLGEAVNIVTRSITDDFYIRMRLVAFETARVHMDGDALFRLIVATLQRKLGLDLDCCMAYARDSCAVNHDAVNRLPPLSVNALCQHVVLPAHPPQYGKAHLDPSAR